MSFDNIIGQEAAVKALKAILGQGRISGSYIFLGPDGVGKLTCAIEFSKALNCEKTLLDACDECVSCSKINGLNHPDIFIIEKEGNSNFIKIDKIREIIYQASLRSYEGRTKVFIIKDAEAMNEESSNALLKLLEEPPLNQILILVSSYVSSILPTVISRCRILKFNPLSQQHIQEILIRKHNFSVDEAELFSHLAMSNLARAIDFKENQMLARRNQVLNDFFLTKRALFREDAINDKKYSDIEKDLNILISWYRDLLVSKFTDSKDILLNIDRCEEIYSYGGKFSLDKLERDLLSIISTLGYIRRNANPKMALFNMAVELQRTK